MNEGIDLLKGIVRQNDRIMVVDMTNIFSFALQQPSPKNDLLYWHYGITFSRAALKTFTVFHPDNIFRDITIIMFPNKPIQSGTKEVFLDAYHDILNSLFYTHTVSPHWTVLKKK